MDTTTLPPSPAIALHAGVRSELFGESRTHAAEASSELARRIFEQLALRMNEDALAGDGFITKEFALEVVVGSQTYLLTCRPRPRSLASLGLSPREKEVVRLVATGLPNKAIANVLEISLWTVATHIRRVFAKLGVTTRAEMIAKILQEGLLELGAREKPAAEIDATYRSRGHRPHEKLGGIGWTNR